MTDDIEQRLAEIETRAKKAADGPLKLYDANEGFPRPLWCVANDAYFRPIEDDDETGVNIIIDMGHKTDADFIEAAWNHVPALIGEIRRLRAQLREAGEREHKLHEALEMLRDHQNGPPLPKYEEGWTKAMEMADEALALQQEAHDGK